MHYPPRPFHLWALWILVLIFSSASIAQTSDMTKSDAALLKSLWGRADVDSAVIIARELTLKYPDNPTPFHTLGRLLINLKKPELFPEAEAALVKSLALNPQEPWMTAWSCCSLAYICYETGRDSLGTAFCTKAIDLNATANSTAAAKKLLYMHSSRKDQPSFPVTRSSAHFVFHYANTTGTGRGLSRSEAAYERAYARLAEFWRVEPPGSTHVYVYRTQKDIESVLGKASHCAFPEKHEIHTTPRGTTGHELTHIFAYQVNAQQTNYMLGEGIASALDQSRYQLAADYYAARALKQLPAITIASINAGWKGTESDYWLSCSFVCYLVDSYGTDRFLALYRMKEPLEPSAEKVYGVIFSEIERGWHARIDSLGDMMPAMDSMMTALSRKDYAAVLACVDRIAHRRGESIDLITAKGQALSMLGEHEDAIHALEPVCARKPNALEPPRFLQWAHYYSGRSCAALGRKEQAIEHLKEAVAMNASSRATAAADSLLSVLIR